MFNQQIFLITHIILANYIVYKYFISLINFNVEFYIMLNVSVLRYFIFLKDSIILFNPTWLILLLL